MARVTYGSLVTELAGSIGGVTFQRNSSGPVARLRPNKKINPSQAQSDQQLLISQLVSAWGSLNLSDKGSWDTFAGLHSHFTPWNEEKTLNGFQWFVSCNLNLLITGQATIDAAPAWTSVSPIAAFTLQADEECFSLEWGGYQPTTGYRLIAYATAPIRMNSEKLRRSILLVKQVDVNQISSLEITPEYSALFNLTWADFFNSANCTIIAHVKLIQEATGLASIYTTSSLKIS